MHLAFAHTHTHTCKSIKSFNTTSVFRFCLCIDAQGWCNVTLAGTLLSFGVHSKIGIYLES